MFHPRKERQETITKSDNTRIPQPRIKYILRTVPHNKTFHFYEGIGKPTEHKAANLFEFRNKISIVQVSCLAFHTKRKDFKNWINDIIGDPELAEKVGNISPEAFNLKMKLYSTVNTRIKELRETFSAWKTTSENVFIAPQISHTEHSKQ